MLFRSRVAPSLGGQRSLAGRRGVGGRQPLRGGGGREGGLQVDRLVEKLVADQHDEGEETQLEVTEGVGKVTVGDSCPDKTLHTSIHTLKSWGKLHINSHDNAHLTKGFF